MKNFQKFFKRKEEDVLDLQTLSTVSHKELCEIAIKFHSELKEVSHVIEAQEDSSKQLKKELSKSTEELKLYKTHCEDLQNHARTLALENDSLNTLNQSKIQEIKYFRDKNSELEKQCENAKNISEIMKELEIFRQKHKESLEKIANMDKEKEYYLKEKIHFEGEIQVLKERYEEIVQKVVDSETMLKAKSEQLQKCKFEAKSVKASMRELQKHCKELEALVNGKAQRIFELETNVNNFTSQLKEKKLLLDGFEMKFDNVNEALEKALSEKKSEISAIQEKYENEVRLKIEENSAVLSKNLEEYKIKITSLEIERSQNFSQVQRLVKEVEEVTGKLKACEENLEVVQKKRALAKEEVLKLTQKIGSPHDRQPVKPNYNIMPQISPTSLQAEQKALQILKIQLDVLYKSLMDLMLTSNTMKDPVTKSVIYQIPSEDFSKFEKDLNKTVMNVHEASENPNFIEPGPGWMGKISNWAPSKLLSCMSSNSRTAPNNPPEKRRSSYKGFF